MNIKEFESELSKLNINLSNEQKEQLEIYANFLIEYNNHTNLTSIKDIDEIYLKHFYDSITIIKSNCIKDNQNILDIGTGAGFPGLVLKIINPTLNITLLDSNNKKITFLKELTTKLNIDVELINERAEEYIKNKREYFDIVTSRAVKELNILSEISIPYVKLNGYFIAMKANYEEELKKAEDAINILGGKLDNIITFNLPIINATRSLVIIRKIKETEKKYPRIYDKIIKKPLQK